MSLQFENLVGKREARENNEAVVIAEATHGNFRVTPKVAEQLGITDGSFVAVQKSGDTFYIGKGQDGVAKKDEAGNYETDNRGRRVFEEGQEGYGALAREVTPGSNILRFSVASAWQGLGADGTTKKVYELGEGVEAQLNTGKGTYTTMLFPLVHLRDDEKQERVGAKKEEAAEAAEAVETQEVVDPSTNSDFSEDI